MLCCAVLCCAVLCCADLLALAAKVATQAAWREVKLGTVEIIKIKNKLNKNK
jgi:hypothetical protein